MANCGERYWIVYPVMGLHEYVEVEALDAVLRVHEQRLWIGFPTRLEAEVYLIRKASILCRTKEIEIWHQYWEAYRAESHYVQCHLDPTYQIDPMDSGTPEILSCLQALSSLSPEQHYAVIAALPPSPQGKIVWWNIRESKDLIHG